MPQPTYPVTIDTIGKLIEHGMGAFLWCPACSHCADIDLERLAARVGRDWMFVGRRWPVKCAQCGEPKVEVRITPQQPPHPQRRP